MALRSWFVAITRRAVHGLYGRIETQRWWHLAVAVLLVAAELVARPALRATLMINYVALALLVGLGAIANLVLGLLAVTVVGVAFAFGFGSVATDAGIATIGFIVLGALLAALRLWREPPDEPEGAR